MNSSFWKYASWVFTILMLGACKPTQLTRLSSPNTLLELEFLLTTEGQPAYRLYANKDLMLDTSRLGFDFENSSDLRGGLKITQTMQREINETWEMPWGEQRMVKNHCNELRVSLTEKGPTAKQFDIVFRLFDDGLGFRYEFPAQHGMEEAHITEELTEFNLTSDPLCWWIPGDWDSYEHIYYTTRLSEIDAISKKNHPNLVGTYIEENAVNTPFTVKTDDGMYMSFHEAALTDYAGMTLRKIDDQNQLQSSLVGGRESYKVKRTLPFETPWRTIQLANEPRKLVDSRLIVNLNEPSRIDNISAWFSPTKYMGIWWEMHLGKASWDKASAKHGATTENAKKYIDFASENGIGALLIEGWNTGWERWIGFPDREGVFDFVTPYSDYDLEAVVAYAEEKGVKMVMHHETSAAPRTYEQQMDTAFKLMNRLGIHAVKTGYVGPIIPEGEHHHGQWMVNHYRKVLENAAKYQIAVNAHEPIKATGIRRTWPNAISREGLRGQEFNTSSIEGGNPTEQLTIVPYTRMLAGPIDYTPGIFRIKLDPYRPGSQVNHTLAQQLALYVIIYSPVQMAADLPEHYEGVEAFQFIREVGVDWEQSLTLNGEIGDYISIARQERGTGNWFVGSITDENERLVPIKLDFLDQGQTYKATLYRDAEDAHWEDNPTAYTIESFLVDSSTELQLKLAAGGGSALSIYPATGKDLQTLKPYSK